MGAFFLIYEHEYEITQGIIIIKGVIINATVFTASAVIAKDTMVLAIAFLIAWG